MQTETRSERRFQTISTNQLMWNDEARDRKCELVDYIWLCVFSMVKHKVPNVSMAFHKTYRAYISAMLDVLSSYETKCVYQWVVLGNGAKGGGRNINKTKIYVWRWFFVNSKIDLRKNFGVDWSWWLRRIFEAVFVWFFNKIIGLCMCGACERRYINVTYLCLCARSVSVGNVAGWFLGGWTSL